MDSFSTKKSIKRKNSKKRSKKRQKLDNGSLTQEHTQSENSYLENHSSSLSLQNETKLPDQNNGNGKSENGAFDQFDNSINKNDINHNKSNEDCDDETDFPQFEPITRNIYRFEKYVIFY